MVTSNSTNNSRFAKLAIGSRRAAPLIAALVLGAIAAVLGWYYLKTSEHEIQQNLASEVERQRSDVVVPVQDLRPGTVLTPDLIAQRRVPTAYLHSDSIQPGAIEAYIGRQLTVGVAAGKPLLAGFFSTPQKLFSEELERGVRAVTIPVDEVSSISGMLRAGDYIDFLFIGDNASERQTGDSVVVPLLQDVVVRATGQITSEQFAELRKRPDGAPNGDPYRQRTYTTVTVALPPIDAQRLILAQKMGKIVAALRNAEDRQHIATGTDGRDLTNYIESFRKRLIEPPAKQSTDVIEYIVGGSGSRSRPQEPLAALLAPPTADRSALR
ncbi:pilus assembly protein CpaB [Acidovorax sp. 62]|uniref:Flp pilus assembly protein CpaB n=1 Tax=Acidovorax sp. 62 TaxID=2035203 RepID=UPI000C17A86F|nr:Flp pilus assembly protein CpaB [Acidovorax sp. 62]PIF93393.1 pilus assembly protein CpaB [Acidovorax sp. 62]